MKGLGYLKWDLYARANDPVFNRYCHKHCGYGLEVFLEAAILLRKNDGNPLDLDGSIEDISITTGIDVEKVKAALTSAITDYKLFKFTDDERFYSARVSRDVKESLELSKVRSEARKGKTKQSNDNQMNNNCLSNENQLIDKCELDKRQTDNSIYNLKESMSSDDDIPKKSTSVISQEKDRFPVIHLIDGSDYQLTEEYIESKKKAFPCVDVMSELWKLEGRTRLQEYRLHLTGFDSYINAWLAGAQNPPEREPPKKKGRKMMAHGNEWAADAEEFNGGF